MARALINLPATAKHGDIIEIRTLVQHPMETGFRPLPNGSLVPRHIINRFECIYDGATIFAAELHPAIAANPFIAFKTIATRSGELIFRWTEDTGEIREERATITVT